jgi:hypothetical protein
MDSFKMMGKFKILALLLLTCTSSFLLWGCVDDLQDTVVTAPGVLQDEQSYWVDDVMVNQRHTTLANYDNISHYFRGSVKNMGPDSVTNARYEIHAWDVYYELDGTKKRRDEEIIAIQNYDTIPSQQELPVNIEASVSSFRERDVEGIFVHGGN